MTDIFYIVKEVRVEDDIDQDRIVTEKILLCTTNKEKAENKLKYCNDLLKKYRSEKSADDISKELREQVDKFIPFPKKFNSFTEAERIFFFKYRHLVEEQIMGEIPEIEREIFKSVDRNNICRFYIEEIAKETEPFSYDK